MTPADEQPFLDAIAARYADDAPRLIYADYLDESGEPERAEFVRVQVALARLPDDHPRRVELGGRQLELRQAHGERWTAQFPDLGATFEFRRGIPDAVIMDAAAFLTRGDELFRRAPVRRVMLRDAGRVMPKLIHAPALGSVRELDMCGDDLGNGGLNLLVRSPHLAGLRSLDLGFNGLDDAGVRLLARASTLPGLLDLSLNDNGQISSDGVRALAESPFFAGLVRLDLSGNDVSDAGVRAVAQSRTFARLRTFQIAGNHIGDAGVAALIGSPLFARLLARRPAVDLRENAVGPVGARLLAHSPDLDRAVTLDLGGNYLGNPGFAAVIGSPHLGRVRVLKLGRNQVTDAGVIAGCGRLAELSARLRVLDLSGNRLTRVGIGVATAARGPHPVTIDLSGNVQAVAGGPTPVAVGDVVPAVLDGVADLRRRVNHPRAD